jgi:o-succinylbenzoate---CoA ligase
VHPLEALAREVPDRVALRAGQEIRSYACLYRDASDLARELRSVYGIQKGQRVATLAGNTAGHVIALHALFLLGVTTIPLNTKLPAPELAAQLDLVRPVLLLSEYDWAESLSVPVRDLRAAAGRKEAEHFEAGLCADDDVFSILFTSGSTAAPKAVPHTWTQHLASASGSRENLGVRPDDAWLCVIPLYHIGGFAIVVRSLLYGTAVVLPADSTPETLAHECRDGVTLASLVPTTLHRMLRSDAELKGAACPKLRAILLGGAAATPLLWDEIGRRGLPVLGTYGMTESCSQVCTAPINGAADYAGTAGLPISGAELRIVDTEGNSCPSPGVGEILVRGRMVMSGYLESPSANAERFVDGWFRTGDIGCIGENGALSVLGRRDDVVISGGENIHPSEIEAVLHMHPRVSGAIVVGVADEEWGQRLAAVVGGEALGEAEMLRWCRDRLGPLKTPRIWKFVDEIPRTASGKSNRVAARALFTNE